MKDRLKVTGVLLLSIIILVLAFAFSSWTQTSRTGRVSEGTAAQRPASANAGDMWAATDTGVLSIYLSGWKAFVGPVTNTTTTGICTFTMKQGTGAGNYTTSVVAPTVADVDGTNLSATMTVATGWKAWIVFTTGATVTANTGLFWLADGTTPISGTEVLVQDNSHNNSFVAQYTFTGDGASHTFKPRFTMALAGTLSLLNQSGTVTNRTPIMTITMCPAN